MIKIKEYPHTTKRMIIDFDAFSMLDIICPSADRTHLLSRASAKRWQARLKNERRAIEIGLLSCLLKEDSVSLALYDKDEIYLIKANGDRCQNNAIGCGRDGKFRKGFVSMDKTFYWNDTNDENSHELGLLLDGILAGMTLETIFDMNKKQLLEHTILLYKLNLLGLS